MKYDVRHSARDYDFLRLEKFRKRGKRGLVFCGKLIAISAPNKEKNTWKMSKERAKKLKFLEGFVINLMLIHY